MGRVTLELSDGTLRKATELAARQGVPLDTFLVHQLDELVAANDRYERAKASVTSMFPDTTASPEQFFDRWRDTHR